MKDEQRYRPLSNRDNHKCFGCSPVNASGLHMKFFTDDTSVVSCLKVPEHLCGWHNLVHGGVISTILDEIMSWAAIRLLKKFILTKSMTVDFIKPVTVGSDIRAEGRVLEVKSPREALMEGFLFNGEGTLCARSVGTFALLNKNALRRMGIMDEKVLNNYDFLLGEE